MCLLSEGGMEHVVDVEDIRKIALVSFALTYAAWVAVLVAGVQTAVSVEQVGL